MISKDKTAQINKFRADKKKEKIEVYLFFGFISLALITTGIIVSF